MDDAGRVAVIREEVLLVSDRPLLLTGGFLAGDRGVLCFLERGVEAPVFDNWDPANPRFPTPHVHVEGGKDHVSTGRVSIEAILRQLIVEVGVPARDGWAEVIEENEALFREFRSWS